jgi:hypothetical protein
MTSNWHARMTSATPEILASATYFAAWFAPASLPPGMPKSLVLGMLVEFLVVHSGGFLAAWMERGGRGARRALPGILGLAAVYLLFAGAFGLAFRSWAPVWIMGWLIGSRVLTVLVDRRERRAEIDRQRTLWVLGAVLYLLLAFVFTLLPLPRFGVDDAARAAMDLPGTGIWIDDPHRPLAMGAFYFALLAWAELSAGSGAKRSAPER